MTHASTATNRATKMNLSKRWTAVISLHLFPLLLQLCLDQIFVNAIPYPGLSSSSGTRPRLKPFRFDSNIIEGQMVRVFCQLLDGAQPLSFQWMKDGQPLLSSPHPSSSSSGLSSPSLPHIEIQTYRDYSSLVIDRVDRRRDTGNYTCLVSNSYGSDQHNSMLVVQEPPSFIEQPRDISIGLHKSTFTKCRANSAHAKPVIKWNRILLNLATPGSDKDARREHIINGEELHLSDVRIEDAGLYECVAENPHNGLAISHTFTITVNVPPYFESKTDQVEVKRGETAKLVCEVYGAKPVSIVWLRQNSRTGDLETLNLDYVPETFTFPRYTALEKNFDIYFHATGVSANSANSYPNTDTSSTNLKQLPYVNNNRTLFELHINSVNFFDNGQYACRALNDYGEDIRRINLFVQDVPAAVRQVQVDQIWSRDVSISWLSPESIGNSAITQYILQYWKEVRQLNHSGSSNGQASGYRLHEVEVSAAETHCTIKSLSPGTSYASRVIAVNQFGRGPSSALVRFMTHEEKPNASPIDIVVEPRGTTSLRVRWKAPPKSHWNGQLGGYYLGYRLVNSDSSNDDSSKVDGDAESVNSRYAYKEVPFTGTSLNNYQEEYLLNGLRPASTYGIVIRAFNGIDEGPTSQEILSSTAFTDPPPKPVIQVLEAKENSISIRWDPIDFGGVVRYIIHYKEDRKSWMELEVSKPTLDSSQAYYTYKLVGLHQGTVYQIYMKVIGDKGAMSEPSDTITVRTEGEIPLVNMLNSNVNLESQQPFQVAPIPTLYSPTALQPTLATYQQQVPPYLRLTFIVPIVIAVVVIVIACVSAYVYIRVDDRKAQMTAFRAASNAYAGTLAVGPGKHFQYLSHSGNGPSFNSSLGPGSMRDSSCTQSLVSEEGSLSFRYSDTSSDKSRPLLARPPLPTGVLWAQQQSPIPEEDEAIMEIDSSAYETLPFQKNFQSTPMQSFSGTNEHNSSLQSSSSKSPTAKSPPFPPPPPPLPGVVVSSKSPHNSSQLNKPSNRNSNNIFCHADVHHAQSSGASDANNSDSYDEFNFFTPAPHHV